MEEGTFEPNYDIDVMRALPLVGAGTLSIDEDALRVEAQKTLEYEWEDVLVVTNDARDPRVILIVVEHDGEPRTLRFRPKGATQPIISDLVWYAGTPSQEEDEDVAVMFERAGFSVDVTPCTGPDCEMCQHLRALTESHVRPS